MERVCCTKGCKFCGDELFLVMCCVVFAVELRLSATGHEQDYEANGFGGEGHGRRM